MDFKCAKKKKINKNSSDVKSRECAGLVIEPYVPIQRFPNLLFGIVLHCFRNFKQFEKV